jgi:hypothetical protein
MDSNASALQGHRLLCNRRITVPYYGRDITKNTSIHMGYSFRFALGFTITRYGFDLDLGPAWISIEFNRLFKKHYGFKLDDE